MKLWVIGEIGSWVSMIGDFSRLKQTPKHYLVDPALSAWLLGYTTETLRFGGEQDDFDSRFGSVTGRLFEALVVQSLQTYALTNEAALGHFRAYRGEREVDFVMERGKDIVAIEVKYSPTVSKKDVRHLLWLKEKYRSRCKELMVVNTGQYTYRREEDDVLVVPAASLGA